MDVFLIFFILTSKKILKKKRSLCEVNMPLARIYLFRPKERSQTESTESIKRVFAEAVFAHKQRPLEPLPRDCRPDDSDDLNPDDQDF